MKEPVIFEKNYARDIPLILEQRWVRALKQILSEEFGFKNPHEPWVAFYVTGENMEIWEHAEAIHAFQDWLLEHNTAGPEFMTRVVEEYKGIVHVLKQSWEAGATTDTEAIATYLKLSERGFVLFCIWYYSGIDERTPESIKTLTATMRETDEYCARNYAYVRDCVVALGCKRELANFVLATEFLRIPSEETLRARSTGVVIIDSDEVYETPLEDFAVHHPEFVFKDLFAMTEGVREVTGRVAYTGKVTGRARIVKNERAMEKVLSGDIIVSPMTTPDFMPAMQRAAAFVTDEGGTLCHAAIVARELKKPCIIGTKVATQVLHDGDLVEVDADHGVVRILERV